MAVRIRFLIFGVLVMSTALTGASADAHSLTQLQKKQAVIRLLKSFAGGDPDAFAIIDPKHYRQHNLRLEDGLEGVQKRFTSPPPGAYVKVFRALVDGDHVVTHSEFNFGKRFVAFDIFRFEHNRIVEHWDNL